MNPLRIVIADDETLIRMDMRELLEEAGHEVVGEAPNGRKAVELAKKLKPDLCIFDVKMPEMDGIEAAKIVWKEKIAPVVLLTAFSQPEIVKRATDAGVQAYLVKPVQEANLFPAIEVAMSRYQDMQGLEDELFKVKDTLEMRKLLDRAKGILMDAHNISESQAFSRIQKYSMAKRKTIKEVAEAIIRAATK
ncbi:two-component system, regulatory protein [Anaerovibrio sp. JC8]|uniref:ANTAR domain-containing response regulator n=1 Tax=Anaerovibrio sp. JC8 TaxID=1240085 RepID=UPI000A0E29BA|nr:response regulator [Anaerovibrio sp. JC8]ORT99455.1 two-component system, regulatory protein [Anaerovibrio sp. JC8]